MLMQQSASFCGAKESFSLPNLTLRKPATVPLAKKRDLPENSPTEQPHFSLKISNTFLAQSAIAVFSLGFIDAGYSGDWSRIGVISKENEDLLKAAAFVVVPLCLFLIFSLPKKSEDL
ncbi:unnamed protein product [Coffea canephora]|uniref:DH200=94 genomic scaffold, scaffold_6437 n=1 Tax=Coffea canephora TaxID=49390 RepID=A0A068VM40_COFCA|nr:unnamed protein product [Coffea canephora]